MPSTDITWSELHGDHFRGARVLVTGGAGFIGSHLCAALVELGAQVIALDDLCAGNRRNFEDFQEQGPGSLKFVEGSILDAQSLENCTDGCRTIFHQAALGSVPRSIEQPSLYANVNITGTLNVLEAARKTAVERIVYAASSSAYGDTPTLPKIETMPPSPLSPYAATKLAGEGLMSAYSASYGLDAVSLRYFNIFGPRQSAQSAYAAVIAAFARALSNDQELSIHGDGEQSRDFTFVANAVHANLLAARRPEALAGSVINVACGHRITVNELARLMIEHTGGSGSVRHVPARAGDVLHSLADLSRARTMLGYEPVVDFEAGLATTLEHFGCGRNEGVGGRA
jgi:nucleoside-diphosphate-sugar epimerase